MSGRVGDGHRAVTPSNLYCFGMALRPYRNGDLDQLLDLWYRASLIAHPFLTDDFFEQERRRIAQDWLPVATTSVYEIDGQVVGFLALIGNEVGGIFVDPDFQGRGIGRALMDDARHGRPYLELEVFAANANGRRFYAAYGFQELERTEEPSTGHPVVRLRIDTA